MSFITTVIVCYLVANIGIALLVRHLNSRGQEGFFLAGRRISPLVFFISMAATNFSAFTIFGFSGAGYRLGYAFYPLMAFGTGFMALSFALIGVPLRRLAKERGYITPADFIQDRYKSPILKKAFSLSIAIFTMPYMALQGMFAGKILQHFAGISYEGGCLAVLVIVMLYVGIGGLRSVAWTDVFQGLLILAAVSVTFLIVIDAGGGFVAIHEKVRAISVSHFSRAGADRSVGFTFHLGYVLLWFFSVPLFPQIFQRFYSAKGDEAILKTMCFYPLATTFLFFMTVAMGVMALGFLPPLPAGKSDEVMMAIVKAIPSPALAIVVIVGALAALMSTLSAQMLSLSAIIVQDFLPSRLQTPWGNRTVITAISLAAFCICLYPPLTILGFLSKLSFQGYASCAPAVFLGLFWRRTTALGATSGLLLGIAVTILGVMNLLPSNIPNVFFILSLGFGATILLSLIPSVSNAPCASVTLSKADAVVTPAWLGLFGVILLLGCDFWNWSSDGGGFWWGLPLWLWYFFALGLVMFAAFFAFTWDTLRRRTETPH